MIKTDPVCGMEVEFDADTRKNVPTSDYDGHTYFFCSDDCRDEFMAQPDEYATDHNAHLGTRGVE